MRWLTMACAIGRDSVADEAKPPADDVDFTLGYRVCRAIATRPPADPPRPLPRPRSHDHPRAPGIRGLSPPRIEPWTITRTSTPPHASPRRSLPRPAARR